MKALIYTQPQELKWQEYPDPVIDDGEVVLEIEAVGICGSDLHAWHGHDPRRKPGLVLGHEFSGKIVDSKAPGFAKGVRYTGNPLITCGTCTYCVQGRNNLCTNRTMVGMTRAGAFAELMSIPAASLIAIPDDMPSTTAALTEPVATAWHAVNCSLRALHRPLHECNALIIGGGAIGMFSALLLSHLGVRTLTVAEINGRRQADIKTHTNATVINPLHTAPHESSYEFIIDAVGAKVTRDTAFNAVKPGGVIMHVGLQDWASEIDMRKLTLAEITLLGTYTYTTADLQASVTALHEGVFGDLSWIETRKLSTGAEAFTDLHQGQCSAKVVLANET